MLDFIKALHARCFGEKAKDPWESSEAYVARFKRELLIIALVLSNWDRAVSAVFIRGKSRVELHDQSGKVIARISIRGRDRKPERAEITTNLSVTEKAVFGRYLPTIHKSFKALSKT